jgi:hypothetical protein
MPWPLLLPHKLPCRRQFTAHGSIPDNPAPVPTLVALTPQQLARATANVPPTINALASADPVGQFFAILEVEFPMKSSEKILQLATLPDRKMRPLKCFTGSFLS